MSSSHLLRWRLILGPGTEDLLGQLPPGDWAERDQALGYLYDREGTGRNVRGGDQKGGGPRGGMGESQLTVPEWINAVHKLFPQRTIERLEKDALERYQLQEIVTNPELLARAQPNMTLLKAVLHTKHLMNQEVLQLARNLVRQMVQALLEKIARPVQSPFSGVRDRRQRSSLRIAKNFDAATTIERNLAHYDPAARRLFIRQPHFTSRVRRQALKWQIIILVDESGSMLSSVIHSAVTASIFFGLKSIRTHLCLFDTNVVDVTPICTDPVETLMKVQLGGGTDIGNAMNYAGTLVENPRQTIVILITDFYEGAPEGRLLAEVKRLAESGVQLLGLAALDPDAQPSYNHALAAQLVRLGMHVGAMTPGELANWVAEKIK